MAAISWCHRESHVDTRLFDEGRWFGIGGWWLAVTLVVVFSVAAFPCRVAAQSAWSIGAREVPPPAGASETLSEAIASAPAPDVAQGGIVIPATEEGWLALQQGSGAVSLDALSAQFSVSIERDEINGVTVYRVTPDQLDPHHDGHLFLHVHGGAYVLGGGDGSVGEAVTVASRLGIQAVSVDYRMPPAHPFPAAVDDTVFVYQHLLQTHAAASIVIGGTSAGGGLALAVVHRLIADGVDTPGAIYAGTPWADLTKTGDTLFTNEGLDRVLVRYEGLLEEAALLYADGRDLKDPLLSPVYGNFDQFPPTYFITGTRDMFLSDTVRTHRKMRVAGVAAELNVYEAISHAEYLILADSPESKQAFDELGDFLRRHLP